MPEITKTDKRPLLDGDGRMILTHKDRSSLAAKLRKAGYDAEASTSANIITVRCVLPVMVHPHLMRRRAQKGFAAMRAVKIIIMSTVEDSAGQTLVIEASVPEAGQ